MRQEVERVEGEIEINKEAKRKEEKEGIKIDRGRKNRMKNIQRERKERKERGRRERNRVTEESGREVQKED